MSFFNYSLLSFIIIFSNLSIGKDSRGAKQFSVFENGQTSVYKTDGDSLLPELPDTQLNAATIDNIITLYWGDEAMYFDQDGYKFEGYAIFKCRNLDGYDPKILKTFDVKNNIIEILDYYNFDGFDVLIPFYRLQNRGLDFVYDINVDAHYGVELVPGSSYYFYIKSFAVPIDSSTGFIEKTSPIIEVIAGSKNPDLILTLNNKDFVEASKISGNGDGLFGIEIIDATVLNGHSYQFTFNSMEGQDTVKMNLIDFTENDTILYNLNEFSESVETKKVYDGFRIVANDVGLDSIYGDYRNNNIKEVIEVKGPNGTDIIDPINVLDGNLNSTSRWHITAENLGFSLESSKLDMNWNNSVGHAQYEIRFTSETEGSEYYISGHNTGFLKTAPLKNDFKAANKVPFQIWTSGEDLVSEDDDKQLIIKILDSEENHVGIVDSVWTQFPANDSIRANQWERIFAYFPLDSVYPEVLPDESGNSNKPKSLHKIGNIIINGELPEPGTVIRIDTWRPLSATDTFTVTTTAPILKNKKKLEQISVFPNPYFGANPFSTLQQNYMRFTDLPQKVIIRIFTLSGQLVQKIEKESDSPWLDWDLRNRDGKAVASGIYIAHLDMPHIGKKIMKLAVVQDNR